jgi:hypothetical protein
MDCGLRKRALSVYLKWKDGFGNARDERTLEPVAYMPWFGA